MRLERLVDGLSAALFRGRMHPVDLANRLIRYVDLSIEEGPAGPEIANRYRVLVNPDEIDQTVDLGRLGAELANAVGATAAENGWRTGGTIEVRIEVDPKVTSGSIKCLASTVPGQPTTWAHLIAADGAEAHELQDNRLIVGRAADADVQIVHPRVSRHHALLIREAGSVWIADLGSANGTRVDEVAVGASPVEIRPGSAVSLGPATFSLRLL